MVRQGWGTRRALVCAVLVGGAGLATAQPRDLERLQVITGLVGNEGSSIGITIEDVADNDAADEGAFVSAVRADSPAEAAGFAEGDVVVTFDGERVRGVRQLTRLVRETPGGRTVEATVLRGGSRVELEVTPESASRRALLRNDVTDRVMARLPSASGYDFAFGFSGVRGPARLGITVQELSSQLAEYFQVEDGVLVSSVEEASVAAEAGLMAGDVITTLDGRTIDSDSMLRRRLSGFEAGEDVAISVTRAGQQVTLSATLGDERSRRRRLQFPRTRGSI